VTLLTGVSAANLINLLVRGLYRLPTAPTGATTIQTSDTPEVRANMGRTVIYCNRVIRTYLDLQAMNKTNVLLRIEEFDGKPVTTFRGIPIRTCDAILNNEAQVT
jgi:N-formylglutamate amidohydrolase